MQLNTCFGLLQLFDCAHFFCEACALAHFGDRSTAPCPTCRADVHSNKIFQGSANLTGGASLAAWEDPTYAQVGSDGTWKLASGSVNCRAGVWP